MRGLAGALLLAVLLFLFVGPISSAGGAASWKVKDRAGHVAGVVKKKQGDFGTYGHVVDLRPRRAPAGSVHAEPWGGYATAYDSELFEGDINYNSESSSRFRTESGNGLAVRKSKRWVVYTRTDNGWRRVGTAPLSCPSQWVLGAGILLLGVR